LIWGNREGKYFCKWGWTAERPQSLSGKSVPQPGWSQPAAMPAPDDRLHEIGIHSQSPSSWRMILKLRFPSLNHFHGCTINRPWLVADLRVLRIWFRSNAEQVVQALCGKQAAVNAGPGTDRRVE
jgi:hypothetical protein